MACATSSVDMVGNGHCVGSLRVFQYMDIDFTLSFLGHKDLCLLDLQLLERLIGGASIDGLSCSFDKESDGGVGDIAGTPELQPTSLLPRNTLANPEIQGLSRNSCS